MDSHRVMDLLNAIGCLSEPVEGVPMTPERMKLINKCVKELAHELRKNEINRP